MRVHDVIVVGSGCTGAQAAQTLVEAGQDVLMLDVGLSAAPDQPPIPPKDFLTLRKTDSQQYRYFLGEQLEGVGWGAVGKGEQVTPPRSHMQQRVNELLPVRSSSFEPFESLGYGGLGISWGIGCWEWSPAELTAAGLSTPAMRRAYNTVARRIGISAARDAAADYTLGTLKHFQPAPQLDRNHQRLYTRYLAKQQALHRQGFVMGRPPLALLTEDFGDRHAYSYKEMDFYSDAERSAWRPWMTVDALRQATNFTYRGEQLVLRFSEQSDRVAVHCQHVDTERASVFYAKRLVLASGVLGTARIVLRSRQGNGVRLPLLSNPYSYVPCLQPTLVGKEAERRKLGFAQLSLFLDEKHEQFDTSMASIYGYQSLMLFRMVRQVPLGFADARTLLRYLSSGLVIMGIHQPDKPSSGKFVELLPASTSPSGDELHIEYALSPAEQQERERREKKYVVAMRGLGAYALKRIDPGFGASIHYAGVLPFSEREQPFTLAKNGRLHGSQRVFVADGSGFTYLPAKGLTFSLMANAHLVAEEVLRT